ncbi:beta-1,6-galactosyltransferase GALT29A isoform X1 [Apium graveolens]|uniref:beta-1,6-galactosyltransferase GALT29A isoform X1 n=1 Tax=Apium graveolens TaxID=4045 RepID=UPI003D7942E6
MKQPMKHLLSFLIFIVLVVSVSFQMSFKRGYEVDSSSHFVERPVLNATLLKLACVDMGESKLSQEIESLLEGNFKMQGRTRTFMSTGKQRIDVRVRSARGIPVSLRSPEFYRLWMEFRKNLQKWSRRRRFQGNMMSNLVDSFNGIVDVRKKHKTCAVVGNSGILLNHEYGKLIDSHEVVIRLNNARISHFEKNVGLKTSISFVNSNILHLCARRESCYCHPYGEKVPIVMYMCQPVHFFDYVLCNSSHKAPLIITDPGFDALCSRIVKYYSLKRFIEVAAKDVGEWGSAHDGINFHYSSGMQAIMLALGVCDEVSIFGFGKSDKAKHHYHTNQKAELQLHDYEAEYEFYRDLVHKPRVIPFISDKFKFPAVILYQ